MYIMKISSKERLLKLMEIFESETNEENKYSVDDIINRLQKEFSKKVDSEIYDSKLYISQPVVSENIHLKYYLDKIHKAIFNHDKLKFQYGNYDTYKNFNLHHNGGFYIVHPYNLVWSNDFYYLVAYDEVKKKIINYRVDRMRSVEIEDVSFEVDNKFEINTYLKSCFNMYPGKTDIIEIKFINKLINAVIDRFGKEVAITNKDDKTFTIRFEASVNEGLLRWVLNWGADAEVLLPKSLKDMINGEIIKMLGLYK